MSETYLAAKLREALAMAGGNRVRAQRLLLTWVQEDERLLRQLVSPFLKAIAMSAVDRTARQTGVPDEPRRTLSDVELDKALSLMGRQGFGRDAPAGEGTAAEAAAGRAGMRLGTLNAPPPTKAGEQHVRTIKALAALYQRRRDA